MGLSEIVKAVAAVAGVVLGGVGGGELGYLAAHHNKRYNEFSRGQQVKVAEKVDGFFSSTVVKKYSSDITEVERYSFFGLRHYYEINNDGHVDGVFLSGNAKPREFQDPNVIALFLSRDKAKMRHPDIFREADEDFQAQMRRFAPLLEQER